MEAVSRDETFVAYFVAKLVLPPLLLFSVIVLIWSLHGDFV